MCFFVHWAGSCCRWLFAAAGSCCRWLLLLALAAGACCWLLRLALAAAGAALVWFCCSFDGFLLPRSSSSSSSSPLPLFDSCAKLFPFLFFSFLFLFFIPFSSVLTPPHIQAASQFAPSHTGAGSNLHDSTLGHSTVSRSPLPTQSEGCPFPRCNGEFQVFFFLLFHSSCLFLFLLLLFKCMYIDILRTSCSCCCFSFFFTKRSRQRSSTFVCVASFVE